jgi:hypothetical protein
MNDQLPLAEMTHEIRGIFATDPQQGQARLVQYITQKLAHLNDSEKIAALQKLTGEFEVENSAVDLHEYEEQVTTRLFALILGREVTRADLSSKELLHRLAQSLNTVFDNLNKLIGSINATFEGKTAGDETIRAVIGGHLQDEDLTNPLENYLGKISRAFLETHLAFKSAAHQIVGEILNDLDPQNIDRNTQGGLKFGPMRKAESYDIYTQKFNKCRNWFESERFFDDLLREFEKNCRNIKL